MRKLLEEIDNSIQTNAFDELDAVIFATPLTSNALHRLALEANCHVIDVGVSEQSIAQALTLDNFARGRSKALVVMAGLAPGLSGLMGLELANRFKNSERIDIILMQSSKGTAGEQGVRDMLDMLTDQKRSAIIATRKNEAIVRGFAGRFLFELPTPERKLLNRKDQKCEVRYLTAFDTAKMNWQIRTLRFLRGLSETLYTYLRNHVAQVKSKQKQPEDETMSLVGCAYDNNKVELGRETLSLKSDYEATATVALALANMAVKDELPLVAGHLSKFTDWPGFLAKAFPLTE